MATSDLTVINAAATRTGNNPVTTTLETDGGAVAAVSRHNYENVVKAELAAHPWKQAQKITQLARLADDEGVVLPWTAAYQLPSDMLDIMTVRIDGSVITYGVHGNTVLCDASATDEVILHYVWRVPETRWPAWFREGVTRRMEAIFLRMRDRYNEAAERDKSADDQFAKARNRDSQSQTPRDPQGSPLLTARGGTVPARFRTR